MMSLSELRKFLVKAKKSTYASGDLAKSIRNKDKSTTLIFESGDWKYHDNYFGGEPYGGREVVFFKNKPVYIMVYYGRVYSSVSEFGDVYKVLQSALKLIPENNPYRGPEKYVQGGFRYENHFTGEVDNFSGEESIFEDNKEIYKSRYIGGLVDLRK